MSRAVLATIERPAAPPPSLRRIFDDFGGAHFASAVVAFVFCATGPVAILLSLGTRGGISAEELASWLFGAFFLNGLLSVVFCWIYRQPLVCLWTIPGAVLVGPALGHMSYPEAVGAFVATGALTLLLGLSGWVRRAMDVVPMPIVMSMVAGVFLRFGLDLVFAIRDDFWIAAPMVAAFVAASATRVERWLPPLVAALLVGIAVAVALGRFAIADGPLLEVARPILHVPVFSLPAMIELVLPLAITVLVVHNGQGVAVLRNAGHEPPVNAITIACGAMTIVTGIVGSVPTCLTGPTNAILAASGERPRQYTAGIFVGVLASLFGLFGNDRLEPRHLHAVFAFEGQAVGGPPAPPASDLAAHRVECVRQLRRADESLRAAQVALRPLTRPSAGPPGGQAEPLERRFSELELLCLQPALFHGDAPFRAVRRLKDRLREVALHLRAGDPAGAAAGCRGVDEEFDQARGLILKEIEKLLGSTR